MYASLIHFLLCSNSGFTLYRIKQKKFWQQVIPDSLRILASKLKERFQIYSCSSFLKYSKVKSAESGASSFSEDILFIKK